MIIFWAITPLISSTFARTPVTRATDFPTKLTAELRPLKENDLRMTTNFEMQAYGYLWLDQDLPPFTSKDSAFVPFEPINPLPSRAARASWTSMTERYYANLTCEPALVKRTAEGVSFDNKKGCVTQPGVATPSADCSDGGLIIGWFSGQANDYYLSGMGCASSEYAHTFLAVWGHGWTSSDQNATQITALFCEPHYWSQNVSITVDATNKTVLGSTPVGQSYPLGFDRFNVSTFEYILGTGGIPVSRRADVTDSMLAIDQAIPLGTIGWNNSVVSTNMLGFTIGATKLPMHSYLDSTTLGSSFEKSLQLLFALSIQGVLEPSDDGTPMGIGKLTGKTTAVMLIRPIALAVEIFLFLTCIMIAMISKLAFCRRNELRYDPASLTAVMTMMPPLSNSNEVNTPLMQNKAPKRWFLQDGRMSWQSLDRGSRATHSASRVSTTISEDLSHSTATGNQDHQRYAKPIETTYIVGTLFTLALISISVLLIVLRCRVSKANGLPLPSRSPTINQVILNYVPVAFATLLEPLWILLNRVLCMLRPLQELAKGNAKASRSLDVRYTSLPPQLIIWRAFLAKHYLLVAVCAMGLSANLLAISFSGLFESHKVLHETPIKLTGAYNGTLVDVKPVYQKDHLYAAQANFTRKTVLAPWVSPEAYFLPFPIKEHVATPHLEAIRSRTKGYSARLSCKQIDLDTEAYIRGGTIRFTTEDENRAGRRIECDLQIGNYYSGGPLGGQNNSRSAAEVWRPAHAIDTDPEGIERCGRILVAGFLRANLSLVGSQSKTENIGIGDGTMEILNINSHNALWLACQSDLQMADYELTVDLKGYVKSYSPLSPASAVPKEYFLNGTSAQSLLNVTSRLLYPIDDPSWWHNDTFVDTFFGYFIKTLSNSTLLIDPLKGPPSYATAAPVVEDIYQRLFAINMGMHPDWFSTTTVANTADAVALIATQRVFMSQFMFVIALSLLVLNTVVTVLYFVKRPDVFLKRMPYTISNTLMLFGYSGLLNEDVHGDSWKKRFRFGYGKYIGTDGKPHLGIEREPFVVPWEKAWARKDTEG